MSYEPFALKYRPRVFRDVVGQRSVAETLRNALEQDRVANAFLFCGSRGVGKTSMARILAKALNCAAEQREGMEPCGVCEICEGIARGDDLDVIEIDGASNRGIDEIRAIRDAAGYAPTRGRFKVYIIDEVHMLTIQAFNALLKTLEEPPPHVKFIFATTEARSVPDTIVSRCQRFEFRRIGDEDIVGRLAEICEREGVRPEDGLLAEVARHGEGGLRDSLGLLDQLVSFAGDEPQVADVDRVLGRVDTDVLEAILVPAASGDAAGLLAGLDGAFESGRDADEILEQSCEVLRAVARRQATASDAPAELSGRELLIVKLATTLDLDRTLLATRLLLNARREIRLVGEGRLQLELALLRIARSRDLLPVNEILERLAAGGGGGGAAPSAGGGGGPRGGPSGGRGSGGGGGGRTFQLEGGDGGSGWRPRGPRGGGSGGAAPRAEVEAPAAAPAPPPTHSSAPPAHEPPMRQEQPPVPQRAAPPAPRADREAPPPFDPDPVAPPAAAPAPPEERPAARTPGRPVDAPAPRAESPPAPAAPPPAAAPHAPAPGAEAGTGDAALDAAVARWSELVKQLRASKPRVAALAERGEVVAVHGKELEVELPAGQDFQRDQLLGAYKNTIERGLGSGLSVRYRLRSDDEEARRPATRRLYDDPMVRKIIETFGGGVVSVSQEDENR